MLEFKDGISSKNTHEREIFSNGLRYANPLNSFQSKYSQPAQVKNENGSSTNAG